MTDDDTAPDVQTVADALADPDCRRILSALGSPATTKEVADRCDLSRTTAYRKLGTLREADLVAERIDVRHDGNHPREYVRDVAGVVVSYEEGGEFAVEVMQASDAEPEGDTDTGTRSESSPAEAPDERLERYWSAVSEEL